LSRTLHIEAAGLSSRGRAHTDNQDAFAVFPELGLFVVADGIGGRPAGGVASALALAAVRAALGGDARAPASLLLRAAVEEANQRILATAEGDPAKSGMGATFTGALMRGERVAIAHVGDSRAYLLHARRLDRLTEDHILANDGIWGALDLAERAKLADCRHRLTRALGIVETVEVDVGLVTPQEGDVLLLCTDGLTAALSEREIACILLEHGEPGDAAARLMTRATEKGAEDDATAVVVRWGAQGQSHGRA
jgi:serine/threonine protein phosphatase PrpC